MNVWCSKCEKKFNEVEWVKLKRVGFSGVECYKCVKKRVLRDHRQLKRYEEIGEKTCREKKL